VRLRGSCPESNAGRFAPSPRSSAERVTLGVGGAVETVTAALEGPLPDLSTENRRQLVSTTALLAGAMYQIATPPPPLAELYATDHSSGTHCSTSNPDLPAPRRSRSAACGRCRS
jgi:hypothetical protein